MFAVRGIDGQIFRGALEDLIKAHQLPALREPRRIGHAPDDTTMHLPPALETPAGRDAAQAYRKALAPQVERQPVYLARQIMSVAVVTLQVDDGVERAWRVLAGHAIGQAPVLDGQGRLVGLVSREGLLHVLNEEHGDLRDVLARTVSDVMQTPVVSADPGADVRRITRVLLDYQLPAMPVTDDAGRLVGIVSRSDVLRVVVTDPPLTLWA